jgi:hypothetical protein
MNGTDQKMKSDHHPLFMPDIPFFSPIRRLYEPEAIIPLFHGLSDGKDRPSLRVIGFSVPEAGVKSTPDSPSGL